MIAVILLVAITVVLAAVLYVMLSNMTVVVGSGDLVSADVELSLDGTNWTVCIASVQGDLPISVTYLLVRGASGEILLARQPLSNYSGFQDITEPGRLSPGDAILLPTSLYPSQSTIQVLSDVKILYEGRIS